LTLPCPGSAAGNSTAPGLEGTNSAPSIPQAEAAHKRDRVLRALLAGPLTTFQAEKAPVFDHCLPSTVSELRKAGFVIATRIVTVAGYHQLPARIAEYTLAAESRDRAARVIGQQ
jgi:hypothetical protein